MMNFFAASKPVSPADSLPELTESEVDIFELLTHHLTNQGIVDRARRAPAISLKTAHNHVSNILNKLQVADRAATIVRVREAGLP